MVRSKQRRRRKKIIHDIDPLVFFLVSHGATRGQSVLPASAVLMLMEAQRNSLPRHACSATSKYEACKTQVHSRIARPVLLEPAKCRMTDD